MSRRARLGWVLLHVGATFLAFPQPWGDGSIDLGPVLAYAVPLTALLALRGLSVRRAAMLGFVQGNLALAAVIHWFFVVTHDYGHAPFILGLLAPLGGAMYGGLFQAIWAAGFAFLARRGAVSIWVLAALWAALDHGRSFFLGGFTWGTLGYAQHGSPVLALAPWTGVFGLSFVTVVASLAGFACFAPERAKAFGLGGRRAGAMTLAGVLLLVAAARVVWPNPPEQETVSVAVLQGNIEQGVKWSPDWAERTLEIYDGLTRRAAEEGAALVVWPETAVPGSPDGDPELMERLVALAKETGTTLIVGAVGVEWRAGEEGPRLFDSAYVLSAEMEPARYDKSHLVPFGEYLPLRSLLGRFIRALATGSAGRDVTAGPGPRVLIALGPDGEAIPVGIPICYELLFPDLVRQFAAGGARVLLAITNDAWYGRTGAPYQFLAITALRAAETGLWVARAANTGVSATIDERGRVRDRTAIFETDLLVGAVPLRHPDRGMTFYVRHGNVFAWTCWAAVLGWLVRARRLPFEDSR
ncbi:MAG: apolipoprotein N-acyltransferase [Deltaproteobacteria bacterium]|nr:apolipoprotein N-acyltransferase [Deltaproteobacteria bacterium]